MSSGSLSVDLLWPDDARRNERASEVFKESGVSNPFGSSSAEVSTADDANGSERTMLHAQCTEDLGMDAVFDAAAQGDAGLRNDYAALVMCGCPDKTTLEYRQSIMRDALRYPDLFQRLRAIASAVLRDIGAEHESLFSTDVSGTLAHDGDVLDRASKGLDDMGRELNAVDVDSFSSTAMQQFVSTFRAGITDDYIAQLRRLSTTLVTLPFRVGAEASFDSGLRPVAHAVGLPAAPHGLFQRMFGEHPGLTQYAVPQADVSQAQQLKILQDGLSVAVAAAGSEFAVALTSYFRELELGLALYVGSANLGKALSQLNCAWCIPTCSELPGWEMSGLYDPGLALRTRTAPITNDLDASGASLVMITGTNQGGKTTWLRAFGSSALLMGCGSIVPASVMRSRMHRCVYTHFEHGEDGTAVHGKLDAELTHIESIVDVVKPGDLLVLNEAFSSTNERDCMQISVEIIDTLRSNGVDVAAVAHCYELAHHYETSSRHSDHAATVLLSPERKTDDGRTYRLVRHDPERTAYAEDSYRKIFG